MLTESDGAAYAEKLAREERDRVEAMGPHWREEAEAFGAMMERLGERERRERAVIEAARALDDCPYGVQAMAFITRLIDLKNAVRALNELGEP